MIILPASEISAFSTLIFAIFANDFTTGNNEYLKVQKIIQFH
jgi:hypothetical protein